MKKTVFFALVILVMVACQKKTDYTIKGTVVDPGYEGKNVYVQEVSDSGMDNIDTAVIKNGAFTFAGKADSTVLRFIALDESVSSKNLTRVPVLIEPGVVQVKFDTVVTVTGTPSNDAYNAYRSQQYDMQVKAKSIIDQYNSATEQGVMNDSLEAEIRESYDNIAKDMDSLQFRFMKENIGNDLGRYLFKTSWKGFTPEQQKELLGMTDDAYRSDETIQRVVTRVENYDNVSVGKKFVDFSMQDPQGNTVSLSDYAGKGKYVLVDFWAAWCPPCRAEMPNVVNAYKTYKNKGFEVVGVSLDKDHDAWVKGLKDLNMTWPQMSDVKYWESPVVDLYVIEGIPHTVLLDKDGTILAKDVRGEELNKKLAELMD